MNDVKRFWKKPTLDCQLFVPNNAVGVCYTIHCTKAEGDAAPNGGPLTWSWRYGGYYDYRTESSSTVHKDTSGTCGNSSIYRISVKDPSKGYVSGNVAMREGNYTCTIDWWRGGLRDGKIDSGDLASWRTNSGARYWYHYGRFNTGNRS